MKKVLYIFLLLAEVVGGFSLLIPLWVCWPDWAGSFGDGLQPACNR